MAYKRKDFFYKQAKERGLRSRAYFKLQEIDLQFHLLRNGLKVLDLGAWPGGWLQYILGKVGEKGKVVGIDLVEIVDLKYSNLKVIIGDINDDRIITLARDYVMDSFDLILSDLSPKLSGVREVDQIACLTLVKRAYDIAKHHLKKGGNFLVKLFKGNETEDFINLISPSFQRIERIEPKSSRKGSSEFYLIGFAKNDYSI